MTHVRLAGAARLSVWVALYVVAGVLGRLTMDPTTKVALVWPAAGVAVLWLVTSDRRRLPVDVAVLGVTTYLVNAATAAPVGLALLFTALNCLQSLVFVGVLVLGAPGLLRRRGPGSLRDYAMVLAACAAAGVVGATLGTLGLEVLGRESGAQAWLSWWGRNTAGILALVAVGLLLLRRDIPAKGVLRLLGAPTRRAAELLGVVVLTVVLVVLVFRTDGPVPVGFLLLSSTVLVAVRFSPLVSSVHSLLLGVATVALTLQGVGPFAQVLDPEESALLAQVFVMVVAVTGAVVAFSRDELAQAHADLQALQAHTAERAQLFEGVMDTMQEGIVVSDAAGACVVRNPASRQVGSAPDRPATTTGDESWSGLHFLDGAPVPEQQRPSVRAIDGKHNRGDYLLVAENQESVVIEATAAPLLMPGGETLAVTSFRDVTEARRDRDALAAFAGVVAHDLKRPLTVVTGWSEEVELLLDSDTVRVAEVRAALERISRSTREMQRFIDDLLDHTVVRDAPLDLHEVDVSALARSVARDLAQDLGDRDDVPLIEVQPEIRAVADELMLGQGLANLLGNAVKYVAPGVRPRVAVTAHPEGELITICVRDNGIGVPADLSEQIFEPFRRAHAQDYRGTGLGLAIVRRMAERCGGSVQLRDNGEGQGSTFELRLPAVAARDASRLPDGPAPDALAPTA